MNTWERDDVERWLNDFPLPADLTFRGEKVWPRYRLKKGFGFWLRTAGPYHPAMRGLFSLIVEIIQAVPVGQAMPTPTRLAELIHEWEASQMELPISEEDNAEPLPTNPAIVPSSYIAPGIYKAQRDQQPPLPSF